MTTPIIECVPNISEGQSERTLDAVSDAVESVPGTRLLHRDSNTEANRTVFTFAGPPDAVCESAFRLMRVAAERIDMSRHTGAHPRIGATDVCPLVPIRGVAIQECIELSKTLAARVAEELRIPVYLYEESASLPDRRNLANIRRGEYEGLREKMALPEWTPDYPADGFSARSGATVIGARRILVAFNVTLQSQELAIAKRVAKELRLARDRGESTLPFNLSAQKAIGWVLPSYGNTQVSCNINDFSVTGLHDVYDACRFVAQQLGTDVLGSELIGLVPELALRRAGEHYAARGAPSADVYEQARQGLGLDLHRPFAVQERVLDFALEHAFNDRFAIDGPFGQSFTTVTP